MNIKCSLKIIFFLILILQINCNEDHHVLQKRGLFYPVLQYGYNAATGILVAIAVPLHDLEGQNVFVSYNFEANYNMPNQPEDSFPGPPFIR